MQGSMSGLELDGRCGKRTKSERMILINIESADAVPRCDKAIITLHHGPIGVRSVKVT